MRILYLHTAESLDEQAIAQAFRDLGHQVQMQPDTYLRGYNFPAVKRFDLIFFNHSKRVEKIGKARRKLNVPAVCWCFDLIYHPHYLEYLEPRMSWAIDVEEHTDLCFFTDGTWVCNRDSDSVVWLTQGSAYGTDNSKYLAVKYDVLFAGSTPRWNKDRKRFVEDLQHKLGDRFKPVTNHMEWLYGEQFYRLINASKIVVAPDSPITERYWSNRVYSVLGCGGFLLHPYLAELESQYSDGEELVYYTSPQDLYRKIGYYLTNNQEREFIASRGAARTDQEHTYKHRCQVLLQTIKNKLGVE